MNPGKVLRSLSIVYLVPLQHNNRLSIANLPFFHHFVSMGKGDFFEVNKFIRIRAVFAAREARGYKQVQLLVGKRIGGVKHHYVFDAFGLHTCFLLELGAGTRQESLAFFALAGGDFQGDPADRVTKLLY